MIKFKNLKEDAPYLIFKNKYDEALMSGQVNAQAVAISSFNHQKNEVDARFVNLKFVSMDKFIFFSNYNSPKSYDFNSHNQISATFYWSAINVQIRMKAKINKTSVQFNNTYFKDRSKNKNALAISSNQSKEISSYDEVLLKYDNTKKIKNLLACPSYWGGFSFVPYYFEFWEGDESRINKRNVYKKNNEDWEHFMLEP
ncbi:pyridoxamine 5'-phosphate oxidase family protein [Gammaproteobacteria bacterium]|nr:pyridoxamine 5'-phosphate oxidase family protein [Gammaproteobacteria bacterium]